MKIRLGTPEVTFTVSGTISRPQLIPTDRDGTRFMRAEKFEAELCPSPAGDGPGSTRWKVVMLTLRGRKIVDCRTSEAWTSRRFHYPAQVRDGVPDWIHALAEQVLPDQPPPGLARRVFSPSQPA